MTITAPKTASANGHSVPWLECPIMSHMGIPHSSIPAVPIPKISFRP